MGVRNHSPLIVLFDLLFMLLFVSVLQQERVLDIHLPRRHLPSDVKVLAAATDQELARKAMALADTSREFGFFLPCTGQIECRDLGATAKVALPPALYHKISQLATTSFVDGLCSRLTLHIRSTSSGHADLDYQRLGKDNPCLFQIEGFKMWIAAKQRL